MDIQRIVLMGSFACLFSGLSVLGAVELYNKCITGIVLRPWIAQIVIDKDTDKYSVSEVSESGKRAQGIPEGRRYATQK